MCYSIFLFSVMGTNADVLQQVMVPLISRQHCQLPSFYGDRLDVNMMCAGYTLGARDSCQVRIPIKYIETDFGYGFTNINVKLLISNVSGHANTIRTIRFQNHSLLNCS